MMKKILFYFFSVTIFLQGCSTDDNMFDPLQGDKMIFPAQSQELGKEVAKELRGIVSRLNEMGVDYSDADSSPEFKQRFYEDINKVASSGFPEDRTSISQIQMSPDEFVKGINNLTGVQIEFIERIIEECGKSTSHEDLSRRLISINKDISISVPKIEQERLFNVTAILYYGTNEIRNLEIQGQMIPTPYNTVRPTRLRTGEESGGGGGFWGQCREISEYAWTLAIGAIYYTGEVVKSVTWNPAMSLVAVVLCFQGGTDFCHNFSVKCVEKGWKNVGGQWIKMECDQCYRSCVQNGYWNHSSCPLN